MLSNPSEPIHLSASSINTFRQCPRRFYYQKNQYPLGSIDERYLNLGSAVHKYIEDGVNGEIKSLDDYIKEFSVSEDMLDVFHECVENANQMEIEGDAEVKISYPFTTNKGRDVVIDAYIDLITKDGRIVDWKTSKSIEGKKGVLKDDYAIQGEIYMFVTDYKYPVATFVPLRSGLVPLSISANDDSPRYVNVLCDNVLDAYECGEFPMNPQFLCSYCPYERYCTGDLKDVYIGDIKENPQEYGVVLPKKRGEK